LSLPIARTVPPVERDASSREGRLGDGSVPELLARAYRVSFTGMLMLEPADAPPSSIRFVGGAVVEATGPYRVPEREWEVLGRLLPPETLDFARQHSSQYGVDPFGAVERLMLLPAESLDTARQALTIAGIDVMCELTGDVRYAFVAPSEPPREGERGVEPLGLLASTFLLDSQRERAARSIAPFEHTMLVADVERARQLLPTLSGSVRGVLEFLVRSPGSVQSLRERGLMSNEELVASVCALWITREVTVKVPEIRSSFPPAPASVGPRASGSSVSVPPFAPATSSMLPPRKNSGFIRAERSAVERSAREYAMEQKVEEAWMRAESDPARAQQITAIVLKAIGVFPRNPRLRYYLARLHLQASRLEEAVKELERVRELDPTDAQAEADLERVRARLSGTAR
jgi:hypothetical protein